MKNNFRIPLLVLAGLLLAACAGVADPGIAGDWELVSYGIPSGLQPAATGVDTLIQFKTDGTFSGTVGCNSFGGSYKVMGDSIEFSQTVATLMFCEGNAGVQESFTLPVLSGTSSFALEDNTLKITSDHQDAAIVLARK